MLSRLVSSGMDLPVFVFGQWGGGGGDNVALFHPPTSQPNRKEFWHIYTHACQVLFIISVFSLQLNTYALVPWLMHAVHFSYIINTIVVKKAHNGLTLHKFMLFF